MGKLSGQTDGFLFLCLTGGRGKVAGVWALAGIGESWDMVVVFGGLGYGVRILLLNFDVCSREGSDHIRRKAEGCQVNFNPRSREGSDDPKSTAFYRSKISIHAPRGERHGCKRRQRVPGISSRSREGSDMEATASCGPSSPFQSTLPRGERLRDSGMFARVNAISIHAPARGATQATRDSLPTGSRHFNPRSREGSDLIKPGVSGHILISIHAPARGATGTNNADYFNTINFNHAPARGATGFGKIPTTEHPGISIHAPRGERPDTTLSGGSFGKFQSTLPRGERQMQDRFSYG